MCASIVNIIISTRKYSHFLFKILSKYTPKRIKGGTFSKISSRELPHSKHVSKIIIFYVEKGIFFLKII